MLSYRHEFHAGNHADVLKHLVQIAVLDYLVQKEKPITYIDTHSGAGLYKLTGQLASKNKEFQQGIHRLDFASHPLLQRYSGFFDRDWYAGSVNIAQQILRPTDKIRCFELHSTDFNRLGYNTTGDRRVKCFNSDGFTGLVGQVPPMTQRGLILIDPAYERPVEYHQVVNTLQASLRRFAHGVYMVWYPLLERPEVRHMKRKLHQLSVRDPQMKTLNIELQVRRPSPGMYGSGLFIINPPWSLTTQCKSVLPLLVKQLGDDTAQFFMTDHATT